ncbi:MAG: hypothetical protein OXF85_00070 [Candidatus Saccharibacteria bacterium]|nr:hypothetical protein [Candidatus Saccharibacteria bacterium]MCY4010646.1 hypothetical protein [Candidatus Saccharibacteria bacterium]MCY4088643.1 hypothetical protein [Candidatus Saccharibacteria bacterium]
MTNKNRLPKQSRLKAEDAIKLHFMRRQGEPIIAHDISYLIGKLPRRHGISDGAMIAVLRDMKYQGLLKLKTYKEDQADIHVPAGSTRIKLTNKGRQQLGLSSFKNS